MVWRVSTFLLFVSAAPLLAQPTPASLKASSPAALNLFERDWVLMNWALKFYDADHDILLEPNEAALAAAEFRKLADTNGDGRITPEEYRAARQSILTQG
jgi:hypothetical protein